MTAHPGSRDRARSESTPARWPWLALLGAASILFLAAQISINSVNGWWTDELFALWASDTSAPFASVFAERIAPDTNPPLYFSALYMARLLIADDRMAILALNICSIAAAAAAVLLISRRARLTELAVIAIVAFVLSGPILLFAAEGRVYLTAMCASFVASWCVALAIAEPEHCPGLPIFVAIGTLAALLHVYAALLCGALAAGLISLSLVANRWRGLIGSGLALGLSASITLGIWLLSITDSISRVSWIEFTPANVIAAAWYVKEITVGHRLIAALLALLLLFALIHKATRPLMFAFGIAYSLFIAVPLVASLKQPMILGRYWLIGAPSLIALMSFLARAWYLEARAAPRFIWPRAAIAGVGILFLASCISGFLVAREFTASKPTWKGAEIASPLLKDCPQGSVHVGSGTIDKGPTSVPNFAKMSGTATALFVDVSQPSTSKISTATTRCPVMGWAEHVLLGNDFLLRATDDQLLRLLKIDASPGEVEIRRHGSGFVVLNRRALH